MIRFGLGNVLFIGVVASIMFPLVLATMKWLSGRNIPVLSPAADGYLHIERQAVAA